MELRSRHPWCEATHCQRLVAVVTWTGLDDQGGEEIWAQAYLPDGRLDGHNLVVNANSPGNQRFGVIAMNANGRFLINWSSEDQDGSGLGVYAQHYLNHALSRSDQVP